jgi:hypothetical protein
MKMKGHRIARENKNGEMNSTKNINMKCSISLYASVGAIPIVVVVLLCQ